MRRRYFLLSSILLSLLPFQNVAKANDDTAHATGLFTNTITKGRVSIIQKNSFWFVRLEDDFIHDGSPDPWVALGKDGFQRHGIIGELKQLEGPQDFPIGEKLNPQDFNEVYIWCVEHNTSLGRAKLVWQ